MLFLWEKCGKNERRPFDLLAQVDIVRPEGMKARVTGNILKAMSLVKQASAARNGMEWFLLQQLRLASQLGVGENEKNTLAFSGRPK